MCGIVGYIGKRQALPFLIQGLKKLEYRGYDSSGICVKENTDFYLVKKPGKVSELENAVDKETVLGNIGIAHTRWATHGVPNEKNAHPHLDCTGNIAIVHNGIVENYQSLKELLIKEGHKIISDTDSEIIAHLIEKFYNPENNIETATVQGLKLIEGAFGLAILDKSTEKIIVARKSSPLVIGIGEGENFVASDASAILGYTKNVIYLDDEEMAVLTKDGYTVKKLNGQVVDKKIHQITMTVDQIEKKGFKHFMFKEIFEQPEAIENTLRGRLKDGKVTLSIDIDFSKIDRIIITACGTSYYSSLIGKYVIENIADFSVETDYASEFRYRNPIVRQSDLIIAISQSGETADTLAALKEAKNFLYLGRNLNFPVALEGALKLKEISYIHAEGYPAAEMKHGPIALIDE